MRAVAALLLLAAVQVQANDWEVYLRTLRPTDVWRSGWLLLQHPAEGLPTSRNDFKGTGIPGVDHVEGLLPLLAAGDLDVYGIAPLPWRWLRAEKGWDERPRWILLDPEGRLAAEGPGAADLRKALSLIRGSGFVPSAERRAAFLKANPDHGEAWTEAAYEGLWLAILRFQAWTGVHPWSLGSRKQDVLAELRRRLGAERAAQLFPEAIQALERLAELGLDAPMYSSELGFLCGEPALRPAALRIEALAWQRLEEQRDFDPAGAARSWVVAASLAQVDPGVRLAHYRPSPGGLTLGEVLVRVRESMPRSDLGPLLKALDQALIERLPERGGDGWQGRRSELVQLQMLRGEALLRAGRESESAEAYAAARSLAGKDWPARAAWEAMNLRNPPVPVPTKVQAMLKDGPAPDPPALVDDLPLRLLALDPKVLPDLRRLRTGPAFAAWDRMELAAEACPADRASALATRLDGSKARWVLVQGDRPLAQGEALPEAGALATLAERALPGRLRRLDDWIWQNPDHRGARRERFRLLLARMPNQHLEARLAEEALATLSPPWPRPKGWAPEPDLWAWAAGKSLPQVERRLAGSPRSSELWLDWVRWADLHLAQPSALDLLDRLAPWPPEAALAWSVPQEVHLAVAPEFRRKGQFEAMRAWFQTAWGVRSRDSLKAEIARYPQFREFSIDYRNRFRTTVAAPLREALVALRRDAEVVALDREVQAWLDPS